MDRAERIKELVTQKRAIDDELKGIVAQMNAEKAALNSARKPRKPRKKKEQPSA
jgi:hypothetical protein